MKLARLVDGVIAEFIQPAEGATLAESFHPDFLAELVETSSDAQIGWVASDGNFVPPASLPPGKAELASYARDRRWQAEIAGITVGGVAIATDDRSKTMILGARLAAQSDPGWSTIWQGADGNAYPVNATAIIAISDAVQAHVSATFVALANVLTAIEAGTTATFAEVDAALGL